MKIEALYVSPGHNYFGRHGRAANAFPTESVEAVECIAGRGLRGDRFFDYKPGYAGQVTFFAAEVHAALESAFGLAGVSPAVYRRNVLTSGVDLGTLIGREFELQGVRFRGVAECKPCYWMDQAVGHAGVETWLKGRGGLRAQILTDGRLRRDAPP